MIQIAEHTEGLVPGPGLYRMPAKVYHADPSPEPSLSSSIAKLIIEQSPEHAACAHPRIAKPKDADERDPTRPKEIGTAAHKLILGAGEQLVIIEADDYKTGFAKSERARAYMDGASPILRPDAQKAETLADRVLSGLAGMDGCDAFAAAESEVVAICRDQSGAWLRIMMDRVEIYPTHAIIWDVKTGEQSAAPQTLGRRIDNMNMEIQAALYVHVLGLLFPKLQGRIRFRWIFVENEFPHGLSVAEVDNVGMGIGSRKVAAAIHRWNQCLKTGNWPGYPTDIVRAEFPEWASKRWAEREELDPQLRGVPNFDLANSPWRPLDYGDAA
ncbi:PD-(D/E)XK nuclease-like domain-containing protein [Methylobacterium gnaphalii]|uniref:Putative exodeoxyribonuclease 8 PDDEXK-like domain-containing protein n=1 Tax=Methylobacterium gnaphalii TaxID=1010610 RepID=A0A512JJ28_9HYPH|nr:PD-(D/E)XK nuclease-like domain-containing protein [Methylobacterium gnaphalii]GEP09872.1 hypothetical protein MGN01_17170 [Methylobacterium gnaphalii]GJD67212.1 hypothetical protein MMMDOFMJ_0126 [Methylobacterium gnaphalii]GLS49901.1 hypothetical protein GCM10007885_27530 [Methylobacterium gnaphalii]